MVFLNTYKVEIEATVLAPSEQELKANISALLNKPDSSNVTITSVNKCDCDMLLENPQAKEENNKQAKLRKIASEEVKKLEKEGAFKGEIPDEIVVVDPETGSACCVENPEKQKMMEQRNKKQESNNKEEEPQKPRQPQFTKPNLK